MPSNVDIINQSYSQTLWNITDELSHVSGAAFDSIKGAAMMLGFLLVAFQILNITVFSNKNDPNASLNIPRRMIALVIQVGFISALLYSGAYTVLMRDVIAGPAQIIAERVTLTYIDSFQTQWANTFSAASGSSKSVWSIITTTFSNGLVSTIIASVIYAAAAIITMVVPIVQGKLFLYMYYIGPFALIFSFCDYTLGVAKAWLNLSLSIAWISVFGSIALMITVQGNVYENMGSATGGNDWIQTAVYGITAIFIMLAAFPISQTLFSAAGAGLTGMANTAGLIGGSSRAGAGSAVAGAATAAIAGGALAKIGAAMAKDSKGSGGSGAGESTGKGSNYGSGATVNASVQGSTVPGSRGETGGGSARGGSAMQSSDSQFSPGSASIPKSSNVPSIMQKMGTMLNKAGHFVMDAGEAGRGTQHVVTAAEKTMGYEKSNMSTKKPASKPMQDIKEEDNEKETTTV